MSKVIIFSRFFPSYHPRKGEETFFVEKIWESFNLSGHTADEWRRFNVKELEEKIPDTVNSYAHYDWTPKQHTIRLGNRWKAGDKFSPRVWSGKPYRSKQFVIGPDIEVVKVWNISMVHHGWDWFITTIEGKGISIDTVAKNDGLTGIDFIKWFKDFNCSGQIICWNENINY